MRITYFNYLWDIDGISAGSAIKGQEIIRSLNKLGHQASIHWRTPQPNASQTVNGHNPHWLKKLLARHLHGPKSLALNLKHLVEEQKIIETEKPDILFSRLELFSFSAALVARRNQIPFVLEVDCPTVWEYKSFAGKDHFHVPLLPEWIEKFNIQEANAIIVISRILHNYLVDMGGNPQKMHIIPNGADPDKFVPMPPAPWLQARFHTNGNIVIGWIGALCGWSGLEDLIAVAKEVLLRRPEIYFMFVGGGQNLVMIEQEFANHPCRDHVLLPGRIPHDQIPYFLSMMDIVFAPYPKRDFWYPSSMKIFEYLSSGKTVIATRVGQVEEIIRHGENGFLYDSLQSEQLIRDLINLIDQPKLREHLGQAARDTVIKEYSWKQHALRLEKIFADVLSKKKQRSGHLSTPKMFEESLQAKV